MDSVRIESVADRVVAWHNRHPLAERITREQVQGIGLVLLPYAWRGGELRPAGEALAPPLAPVVVPAEAPAAAADTAPAVTAEAPAPAPASAAAPEVEAAAPATADAAPVPAAVQPPRPCFARSPDAPRGRWWQRLRSKPALTALFSEDFIAPLSPRRVAAWAARHGVAEPPLPPGAPERVVARDEHAPPAAGAVEAHLHLLTAAVVCGDRRLRVLLAPGQPAALLGPRHWSRRRAAATLSACGALLLAALGAAGLRPQDAAATPAAAPALPRVAQALVRMSEPVEPSAIAEPQVAEAEVSPADGEAAVERPPDVEPRRGTVELPFTKPRLAAEDRQRAQAMSASLRRQGPAPRVQAKPLAESAVRLYALVSASTRERGVSERFAQQLQVLAQLRPGVLRAELMQVGNGWRAVCWPFSSAQEAERVRLALADRGLKTEVVEF